MPQAAGTQTLSEARRSLRGVVRLVRPANLPTAAADALAGAAIVGAASPRAYVALAAASMLLYAGGVALNDVFDAELDALERPERPIPAGVISSRAGFFTAAVLMAGGIALAFTVGTVAGIVATAVAYAAVVYDRWAKHNPLWGPVVMGACRALNLLLGMAAAPLLMPVYAAWVLVPWLYVAAVTGLSRGETGQASAAAPRAAAGALAAALGVMAAQPAFGLTSGARLSDGLGFTALFGFMTLPAFWRARREPRPAVVRSAVTAGVLCLTAVDAAWVGYRAGLVWGTAVLGLWGLSFILRRWFAVT